MIFPENWIVGWHVFSVHVPGFGVRGPRLQRFGVKILSLQVLQVGHVFPGNKCMSIFLFSWSMLAFFGSGAKAAKI